MTVKLKFSGWELGGEYLPWVWAQINYWDIERSRWHDVLKTYHLAGHRVVSTVVLPSVHQIGDNEYDFGKARPHLDLSAFLNEAREIGLKVFLWAGPKDCPGVAAAGYPKMLLETGAALARDAKGNFVLSSQCFGKDVFTLPNLISDRLTEFLLPFAEALKNTLHSHIHPDGPVIGMGLTQAPGWAAATSAFAADYSTETVTYYQAFLKKQYSKIANLNKVYGTEYTSYQGIHPPQSLENSGSFPGPRLLDWARFREDYFVQAAEKLFALFAGIVGEKIPVFLSALTGGRPLNLAELEKSRCYSYALPEMPSGDDAFGFRSAAQSRFLLSQNTVVSQAGETEQEKHFRFMRGIAAGVRGWDALAPAGAGMQSGFVSDRQGIPVRHKSQCWELLKEFNTADHFLQSQISGEILLLSLPALERALYIQTPAQPRFDFFGQTDSDETGLVLDDQTHAYLALFKELERFLIKQQYPFLIAEGDANIDKMSKMSLVVIPGAKQMEPAIQHLLAGLVSKGIHVAIVGEIPGHPEKATHTPLQELVNSKPRKLVSKTKVKAKSKLTKTGRLFHLEEFSEVKLDRFLKQTGIQRPLVIDDARVRVTFHKLRNRIFIAAVNQEAEAVHTVARRDGKFVVKDFWDENKYWGGNNEIKLCLPARQVMFWELIVC